MRNDHKTLQNPCYQQSTGAWKAIMQAGKRASREPDSCTQMDGQTRCQQSLCSRKTNDFTFNKPIIKKAQSRSSDGMRVDSSLWRPSDTYVPHMQPWRRDFIWDICHHQGEAFLCVLPSWDLWFFQQELILHDLWQRAFRVTGSALRRPGSSLAPPPADIAGWRREPQTACFFYLLGQRVIGKCDVTRRWYNKVV